MGSAHLFSGSCGSQKKNKLGQRISAESKDLPLPKDSYGSVLPHGCDTAPMIVALTLLPVTVDLMLSLYDGGPDSVPCDSGLESFPHGSGCGTSDSSPPRHHKGEGLCPPVSHRCGHWLADPGFHSPRWSHLAQFTSA